MAPQVSLARMLALPEEEDRTYYSADPEGGEPSEQARSSLGPLMPADLARIAAGQSNTPSQGYSIDPLSEDQFRAVQAQTAGPAVAPAPSPAKRVAPTVDVGRRKTAPVSAPPTYESLAALAPRADAEMSAGGGDPTTPSSMVGKMATGATGGRSPIVEAAQRMLLARQSASQGRTLAGLARAGAVAIGKGDTPGLDQLDANANAPVQEAKEDQARADMLTGRQDKLAQARLVAQQVLAEKEAARKDKNENSQRDRELKALFGRLAAGGRADAAAARAQAADEKRQQTLDERQVGGLEFAPGRAPSKKDADELKNAVQASRGMNSSLDRMERIFDDKGAEFGFGADLAQSEAARQDVLLQLKELAKLGVLNGPDMGILEQILPNPNSVRGALRPDDVRAQMAEFRRQLASRVGSAAETRGYRVTDPRLRNESAAPSSPVPAPAAVKVLRTDPTTGETRVWNGSAWVKE